MPAQIAIRASVPSDRRYLFDTIRETLLVNSAFCKGLHPATLEALIEPVLATYHTLVATPVDETDTILGFIVYRDAETVGFLYVRSQFRSQRSQAGARAGGGIARALLARAGIARGQAGSARIPEIACAFMVTKLDGQRGGAFAAVAESKGYRLRFRPYLPLEVSARLFYGKEETAT